MMKTLLTTAIAGGVLAMAASAQAGTKDDIRDLQARMERVEQSATVASDNSVRLSEMQREVQMLTGQVQELSFRLEQANRRLDAISAALAGDPELAAAIASTPQSYSSAFQSEPAIGAPAPVSRGPVDLSTGGAMMGDAAAQALASQAPNAAAASTGGFVELPSDPSAAYDYASGFLLSGDYQRAQSAFMGYLQAFPNHPRTPDAQFRLGEIHLAMGDNTSAADAFIAHIRAYPNDARAPEAYLKLGTAFIRLERNEEACKVLKTMKSKFPNAAGPVKQRADIEMARINCQ